MSLHGRLAAMVTALFLFVALLNHHNNEWNPSKRNTITTNQSQTRELQSGQFGYVHDQYLTPFPPQEQSQGPHTRPVPQTIPVTQASFHEGRQAWGQAQPPLAQYQPCHDYAGSQSVFPPSLRPESQSSVPVQLLPPLYSALPTEPVPLLQAQPMPTLTTGYHGLQQPPSAATHIVATWKVEYPDETQEFAPSSELTFNEYSDCYELRGKQVRIIGKSSDMYTHSTMTKVGHFGCQKLSDEMRAELKESVTHINIAIDPRHASPAQIASGNSMPDLHGIAIDQNPPLQPVSQPFVPVHLLPPSHSALPTEPVPSLQAQPMPTHTTGYQGLQQLPSAASHIVATWKVEFSDGSQDFVPTSELTFNEYSNGYELHGRPLKKIIGKGKSMYTDSTMTTVAGHFAGKALTGEMRAELKKSVPHINIAIDQAPVSPVQSVSGNSMPDLNDTPPDTPKSQSPRASNGV